MTVLPMTDDAYPLIRLPFYLQDLDRMGGRTRALRVQPAMKTSGVFPEGELV